MSGSGIDISIEKSTHDIERSDALKQAVLFILPSMVITASSLVLFTLLTDFTLQAQNRFAVIILLSVIISLIGTAGLQVFVYRTFERNKKAPAGAGIRSIFIVALYSIVSSVLMSAVIYFFLRSALALSTVDFIYFSILLVLYSMTWAITATFWASGQYYYPAVTFTAAYLIILAVTFGFHRIGPELTITGYTIGVLLMFIMVAAAAIAAFGKARPDDVLQSSPHLLTTIGQNIYAVLFYIFYSLAIFLDKIIVWVYQGITAGTGPVVVGPYTIGSFLGLIPLFSVAALIYFARMTGSLNENRYEGTFANIRRQNGIYLRIYAQSTGIILAVWAVLFILVIGLIDYLIPDILVLQVAAAVSVGSLFLVLVLHNSLVLVNFGRGFISLISILILIMAEVASIFFISLEVWYAAAGFLTGSFIGFLISQLAVFWLSRNFEFYTYNYLTRFAGLAWK
jgi:hypothetical protein